MAAYNGLIQHSFALRNHKSRRPFLGGSIEELVAERFAFESSSGTPFKVTGLGDCPDELAPFWSPLVERGLTTLDPRERASFLKWNPDECQYGQKLPRAFSWADETHEEESWTREKRWERFILAKQESGGQPSLNDFTVKECDSGDARPELVSQVLSEVLAARRSMLFGLSLANRFVNVMLPHAVLTPAKCEQPPCGGEVSVAPWILQPMVSLIRVGRDGKDFRRMYSLSFFLIPVKSSCREPRKMPNCEMERMVNAGWGLALTRSDLPRFDVGGPLTSYVSRLAPTLDRVGIPKAQNVDVSAAPGEDEAAKWQCLTLRQTTETVTLAVALRMAQGSTGFTTKGDMREIGDEVVTSLGSARASAVVAVDPHLPECGPDYSSGDVLPGSLRPLMQTLAGEVRIPPSPAGDGKCKYRLDRSYIDHGDYAIGVLPSNRCLVVTSSAEAQRGRWESGLMQAGWMAYTVIGTASAIGTMRAINGDLEAVDRSAPGKVADIEREVAIDLHEIYDLDITWEAYRLRYRRLRELLGITSDYKALHGKLDALYRETSARSEKKAQQGLFRLTVAIVVLSIFILVGTIVIAVNA